MDNQVDHRIYRKDRPVNGKYEYAQKMHALSVYADTLSIKTASQSTGIPLTTIQYWLQDEESSEYIETLRSAMRSHMAHKYVEGARLALDATIDRLKNGEDAIVNGEIIKVGVKARDCAMIASVCTDKHALLTGMSTGSKAGAALQQIAANLMAALSQANTKLIEHEPDPSDSTEQTEQGAQS